MFFLLFVSQLLAQTVKTPDYYQADAQLSNKLQQFAAEAGLDSIYYVGDDGTEQISLAVIDLTAATPRIGGVNMDNFIYPASVYKMYVAASVLDAVDKQSETLFKSYIVTAPNAVDISKEIATDPRSLLKSGDTVNVNYLLDLMITRSDNTAANCLIDIAGRTNINRMMHRYGWYGSEVTRKFLKRKFEDPGYDTVRGTETCALHAADFMYRVYTGKLSSPWVSSKMKILLGAQLDCSKLSPGLPGSALFYHKTGWFSYWTNDVGIVEDGQLHYIIASFVPLEEEIARPRMALLAKKIHTYLRSRME
ncbi:MAG: serine hydrolase [Ignavibacteriales bacterium]|nr:serine hydrolase [Ignavibacteriales bacterium]